jgi:hypothetical protein
LQTHDLFVGLSSSHRLSALGYRHILIATGLSGQMKANTLARARTRHPVRRRRCPQLNTLIPLLLHHSMSQPIHSQEPHSLSVIASIERIFILHFFTLSPTFISLVTAGVTLQRTDGTTIELGDKPKEIALTNIIMHRLSMAPKPPL